MKIIRNKKNFIIGIISLFFSLFSLITNIQYKSLDLVFGMVMTAVNGCVLLCTSVSPCFLAEKSIDNAEDERDVYIALKSTTIASRVLFYCIGIAVIISGVLHRQTENPVFATIAVSLCSCLLLFSIVYFFVNVFYEKRG